MADTGLRRELTKWDLTALGVNQVLGGAVFLMPALVFAQLGNWSIWAVASVGLLAMCIALCFAEAGSRARTRRGEKCFGGHAWAPCLAASSRAARSLSRNWAALIT